MPPDQTTEGTWIRFVLSGVRPDQKTERWDVEDKDGGFLGEIKWFARWRRYGFFPQPGTVFEQICMREISDFVEERSRARKAA
jgi:hypothetical protein